MPAAIWVPSTAISAIVASPDGRHIDQLSDIVAQIRENPDSRALIVSAWNVATFPHETAACHAFFQFYVAGGKLSCQLYQRSADIFSACRSTSRRMPC